MSSPTFTEVCRTIRAEADSKGLRLSGRKIKHIAGQYLDHRAETEQTVYDELVHDGTFYDHSTHNDPTGDLYLRTWFEKLCADSLDPISV